MNAAMDAAAAHRVASERNARDLRQVERAIDQAVKRGLFECVVQYNRQVDHVRDKLKERGYTLRVREDTCGGRTVLMYHVGWDQAVQP